MNNYKLNQILKQKKTIVNTPPFLKLSTYLNILQKIIYNINYYY